MALKDRLWKQTTLLFYKHFYFHCEIAFALFKTVVLKLKKVKKLYMPLNEQSTVCSISGQVVLKGLSAHYLIIIIIDFIKEETQAERGWETHLLACCAQQDCRKTRFMRKQPLLLPVPGLSLLQILTFRKRNIQHPSLLVGPRRVVQKQVTHGENNSLPLALLDYGCFQPVFSKIVLPTCNCLVATNDFSQFFFIISESKAPLVNETSLKFQLHCKISDCNHM